MISAMVKKIIQFNNSFDPAKTPEVGKETKIFTQRSNDTQEYSSKKNLMKMLPEHCVEKSLSVAIFQKQNKKKYVIDIFKEDTLKLDKTNYSLYKIQEKGIQLNLSDCI